MAPSPFARRVAMRGANRSSVSGKTEAAWQDRLCKGRGQNSTRMPIWPRLGKTTSSGVPNSSCELLFRRLVGVSLFSRLMRSRENRSLRSPPSEKALSRRAPTWWPAGSAKAPRGSASTPRTPCRRGTLMMRPHGRPDSKRYRNPAVIPSGACQVPVNRTPCVLSTDDRP